MLSENQLFKTQSINITVINIITQYAMLMFKQADIQAVDFKSDQTCQLFLSFVSVKYEPISIRDVHETLSHKTETVNLQD